MKSHHPGVDLQQPNMKTVLITGATGLLGRQVVKAFERENWNVIGTGLTRAKPPSILKVDLSSGAEITKVLDDVKYAP
jgi:S-adenosylmethionine synthetase